MNLNSTEKRHIRRFGLTALLFFGCLCVIAFWRERVLLQIFFGLLFILGLGFLVVPGRMAPAYSAWIKIARAIGFVFTIIVLTLAYYLVMTPAGLIKRMIGGRPLPLRPDPDAPTYWVVRPEHAQTKTRFTKRF